MQELFSFYKAESHEDVLSLIEAGAEIESKYDVIEGGLHKIYVPKNIDLSLDKLPLLTAHTDTVYYQKPTEIVATQSERGTVLRSSLPAKGIGGDCRNGCYLISEVMKSASWDKFIFVIFDLEEQLGVGSKAMPHQKVIADNVSYLIGLDCFARDYVAVYDNTDRELINLIEDNFADKELTQGYFTDVTVLARKYQKSPIVLSIGYYNQHSLNEYVIYEDLKECYDTIIRFGDLERIS